MYDSYDSYHLGPPLLKGEIVQRDQTVTICFFLDKIMREGMVGFR